MKPSTTSLLFAVLLLIAGELALLVGRLVESTQTLVGMAMLGLAAAALVKGLIQGFREDAGGRRTRPQVTPRRAADPSPRRP